MRISLKNLKVLIENYINEDENEDGNEENKKISVEIKNFLNKDFNYNLNVNQENENFNIKISGKNISISDNQDIEDDKKLAYIGLGLLYAQDKDQIRDILTAGKVFGLKTEISDNEIENIFKLRDDKNKASFSINNTYFKGNNQILDISNNIIGKLNN